MLEQPSLLRKEQEEKPKSEGPGLFDYIKMLSQTKEMPVFDEHFNKTYNQYVTNMYFSLYQDTAMLANELQYRVTELSNRLHFLFLHRMIPRRKREWVQWYKPEAMTPKLELVMNVYNYNRVKAQNALSLLSKEDIKALNNMQFKGGLK